MKKTIWIPELTEEQRKLPELIIRERGEIFHFSYGKLILHSID